MVLAQRMEVIPQAPEGSVPVQWAAVILLAPGGAVLGQRMAAILLALRELGLRAQRMEAIPRALGG